MTYSGFVLGMHYRCARSFLFGTDYTVPVLILIFFFNFFLADNAGVIVNPKGEMKGTAHI